MPRPEGPFDRLLKRRPERDPAPIIIGGTIAFLAVVIIIVLVFSSVLWRRRWTAATPPQAATGRSTSHRVSAAVASQIPALPPGLASLSDYVEFDSEEDTPVTIGLPLSSDPGQDAGGLGFYTYFDGRWQRLV